MTSTYTIRTRTDVVGTVATWGEAVELARGYWGTTPSIRAAADAATYTICAFGDYVGELVVETIARDWSTLATGGTFVSGDPIGRGGDACIDCHTRPNGHGHFGWYCAACVELPLGQAAV